MEIGQDLRQAREQRGMSIDHLSRITKISPPALRAIEAHDVSCLPARVFTRSFVRTYAREVGLDPEDAVARYVAETPAAPAIAAPTLESMAKADVDSDDRYVSYLGASRPVTGRVMTTIGLALCAIAWIALVERRAQTPAAADPALSSAASADQAAAPRAEVPGGAVGTGGGVAPAAATDRPALTLDFETVGPCWVDIRADEAPVVYRLMKAGDRGKVEASNELIVHLGDPTTFVFSLNGKSGGILGRPGMPATVHMTPENYTRFLASP